MKEAILTMCNFMKGSFCFLQMKSSCMPCNKILILCIIYKGEIFYNILKIVLFCDYQSDIIE